MPSASRQHHQVCPPVVQMARPLGNRRIQGAQPLSMAILASMLALFMPRSRMVVTPADRVRWMFITAFMAFTAGDSLA